MYPILGRYGPFFLYSYTVVLGLGILFALGLTAWQARRTAAPRWADGALVAMLAALVGGRLGFVALHADYFAERPSEAWQVWQGGLNYHGALFAGLLALWLWSRRRQESFAACAGLLAPGLALLSVFGWGACWLEGCAYGRETFLGPLAADLPDEFGVFAVRYRTQLIGLLLALAVFMAVLWLRRRRPPGVLFWLTLAGLSFGRLPVGLLRGDPMVQIGNVRLDVALDAALVIISLLLLQYRCRRAGAAVIAQAEAKEHA